MPRTTQTLIALFALGSFATGHAQQQESLDVRLTRIEESIKAMNQHIEELAKGTNQRIDNMSKRIDDMNRRIDDTNQGLEAGFDRQTNILIAMMGFVAGMSGVVVWFARQERPVSKKHYDKLLRQDEELGRQLDELAKDSEIRNGRLAQHERVINEMSQRLYTMEGAVATLKPPAA